MKTFMVSMWDRCDYISGKRCAYKNHTEMFCRGDLDNRPDWCPLVEVRKPNNDDIKSYKTVWVEK